MKKVCFWSAIFFAAIFLLWSLNEVLTPFILGFLIAYGLNGVVTHLMSFLKLSRLGAVIIVFVVFFSLLIFAIIFAAPYLYNEALYLYKNIPNYLDYINQVLNNWFKTLGIENPFLKTWQQLKDNSNYNNIAPLYNWGTDLLNQVIERGFLVFNAIALFVLTPITTFYFLKDWPRIISFIDRCLPRAYEHTIREQFSLIHLTLGRFCKGQASACVVLAIYYIIFLHLIGLDNSIVIGFMTGMLSFVPYLGALVGFITSMIVAFSQFNDWLHFALVILVFGFGQLIEGNFITPKLVGTQVGLHPLWIIFAVVTGASLYGIIGAIFAVPIAACIGVLARFSLSQYFKSSYYS